jgi:hypothetical protein
MTLGSGGLDTGTVSDQVPFNSAGNDRTCIPAIAKNTFTVT